MGKPDARRKKAIEGLAAALNECFDAAVESGQSRTRETSRQATQQAIREETAGMKETLRMIRRQCGGKQDEHLPIDD